MIGLLAKHLAGSQKEGWEDSSRATREAYDTPTGPDTRDWGERKFDEHASTVLPIAEGVAAVAGLSLLAYKARSPLKSLAKGLFKTATSKGTAATVGRSLAGESAKVLFWKLPKGAGKIGAEAALGAWKLSGVIPHGRTMALLMAGGATAVGLGVKHAMTGDPSQSDIGMRDSEGELQAYDINTGVRRRLDKLNGSGDLNFGLHNKR